MAPGGRDLERPHNVPLSCDIHEVFPARVLEHRRGVFSWRSPPWRSAPWGRKSVGTKGAQGPMSGERFSSKAKPGGRPEASRLEAELSERPLRGRLPVLHCCPSARFSTAWSREQGALPTLCQIRT